MIAYLEQLEQDLVEAIERREATGQRQTGRRLTRARRSVARALTPRPAWLVVAALAVLIAVGAVVVQSGTREERAVEPKPSPAVPVVPPGAVLVSPKLQISGDLTQVDGTTWRGRVHGPGGTGTLTLTGAPRIPADPNNDPQPVVNRLHFSWDVPNGTLAGCIDTTILRRPYGRWVWDGAGKVMTASGILEEYRGAQAGLGGRTMVSTPQKAYIGIGNGAKGDRRGANC